MPSRSIVTEIWGEESFADVSSLAKLVYLRLITGDDVGTAGATRTRSKRLAADLEGFDERVEPAAVEDALGELQAAGLVRLYEDGWAWIPKFVRRQGHSRQFLTGALRQAASTPDSLARAIRRAVSERATELGWSPDSIRTQNPATSREHSETRGDPKPRVGSRVGPRVDRGSSREGQDLGGSGLTRTRTPHASAREAPAPQESAAAPAPEGTPARPDENGASGWTKVPPVNPCRLCGVSWFGPGSVCDECLEGEA